MYIVKACKDIKGGGVLGPYYENIIADFRDVGEEEDGEDTGRSTKSCECEDPASD